VSNETAQDDARARESPVSRGSILMTYVVIFVYLDLVTTKLFFGPISPAVNRAVVLKSLVLFTSCVLVAAYSTKVTSPE
jgi:hypothetical protein